MLVVLRLGLETLASEVAKKGRSSTYTRRSLRKATFGRYCVTHTTGSHRNFERLRRVRN